MIFRGPEDPLEISDMALTPFLSVGEGAGDFLQTN
jgi:hypothetical protein